MSVKPGNCAYVEVVGVVEEVVERLLGGGWREYESERAARTTPKNSRANARI